MYCNHSRGWRLPVRVFCLCALVACGRPEPQSGDDGTLQINVDEVTPDLEPQVVRAGDRISLFTADPEAMLYYTTDGSDPRISRTRKIYSSPLVANSFQLRTYVADSNTATAKRPALELDIVLDPSSCVDITSTGAIPNDGRDDTDAIRRAIAEAKASGKAVCIPVGTFQHEELLEFTDVDLIGTGPRSILHATKDDNQSVQITGDGVSVSDLRLTSSSKVRRAANRHQRLVIDRATHFTVERVTVDGSSAAGIYNFGGSHGVIRDNQVMNTQADGIHNTRETSDILIEYNTVSGTGDDMIAVVSKKKHDSTTVGPSHDIIIRENTLWKNVSARGISVLGGHNITIEKNVIIEPRHAGIYIASEGQYGTYGARDITIRENKVHTAGSTENGHGALMVYSNTNELLTGITFKGNEVYDSRGRGIFLYGRLAGSSVRFQDNLLRRTGDVGIRIAAPSGSYFEGTAVFSGNILEETRSSGFLLTSPRAGSRITLDRNTFRNINSSGSPLEDVIRLESGSLSGLTITNNLHTNEAGYRLQFFIEAHVEVNSQSISANRSPLPSRITK